MLVSTYRFFPSSFLFICYSFKVELTKCFATLLGAANFSMENTRLRRACVICRYSVVIKIYLEKHQKNRKKWYK